MTSHRPQQSTHWPGGFLIFDARGFRVQIPNFKFQPSLSSPHPPSIAMLLFRCRAFSATTWRLSAPSLPHRPLLSRSLATLPSKPPTVPSTWIFTDGTQDARRQCIALAEALKLPYDIKPVYPSKSIAWLPVILQKYIAGSKNRRNRTTIHLPWYLSSPSGQKADPIVGPYPEFVIASGGRAIVPCLEVAKRSMGQSFTVHLGFPEIPFVHFDKVVLTQFEVSTKLARLGPWASQKNYISTQAPLTLLTPARLTSANTRALPLPFALSSSSLQPIVAVLVGRPTAECRWHDEDAVNVVDQCKVMLEKHKAKIILLCSDQTPENIRNALATRIATVIPDSHRANLCLYDGRTDDIDEVYEAALAIASHVVVTADLEVKTAEAVAIGKPTYTLFSTRCIPALSHFHRWLLDRHLTRRLRVSPTHRVPTVDSGHEVDLFSYVGNHPTWGDREALATQTDLEAIVQVLRERRARKVEVRRVVREEGGAGGR